MTAFSIDEIVIPATIDAPDAADFIEMTHVRNEIEADTFGNRDLAYEPAELLPHWQNSYQPQTCLVARVGGQIVARGIYEAPREAGAVDAWLEIEVLPAFRRRGIGSALYERLGDLCRADQRTVQQAYVIHTKADGQSTLPSPTGFGSVSRDASETQFLLHQRMSTDAPGAGMEFNEESWDADRVRALDTSREESPRTMLVVAAEHVPTGTLAGFTELSVPPDIAHPGDDVQCRREPPHARSERSDRIRAGGVWRRVETRSWLGQARRPKRPANLSRRSSSSYTNHERAPAGKVDEIVAVKRSAQS